jgi:hypothetical protein
MVALRDLEGLDELFCSTGVSLFTGLGVSATVGFGTGPLSTSGSRVFVDCEPDRLFNPSAARTPASRISSSVSFEGADFFSRDLDFRGAGVGDSEVSCSAGCGVCVGTSVFFFAGNDHFLRMHFPDENDAAEYCPKKSFQHDAA